MEAAPRKHVVMELGSNAAAIICPDWTDLDFAAQRIATFGNYQAGQSCIAVQRVIVDRLEGRRVRAEAGGERSAR